MPRWFHDVDRRLRQLNPASAGFWLACLPSALVVAAVVSIHEWPDLRAAFAGTDGSATVLAKDCARGTFEYAFNPSADETVQDRARVSRLGVACRSLAVGSTVPVRYSRDGRAGQVVGPRPVEYARKRILLIGGFALAAFGGTALVLIAFRQRPGPSST